jgi:hypothetical protein
MTRMTRYIPVQESALFPIGADSISMSMPDDDAARDVVRVMKALGVQGVVKSGRNTLRVSARSLSVVRKYLRGEIDPRMYRRNMPSDFYGESRDASIYERQLAYIG